MKRKLKRRVEKKVWVVTHPRTVGFMPSIGETRKEAIERFEILLLHMTWAELTYIGWRVVRATLTYEVEGN